MSLYSNIDKQIYYVKIIVGEGCPLRCTYCFVDKEKNRWIEFSTLEKLIELLLYTPWHNKLLHLLWGEPLMYFPQIKHGIEYARKLEKELWKQLDISFCTSWVWFTPERLDFIRENDIYLAWSIDWPSHIHNRNRIMASWKSSFELVIWHKNSVVNAIKDTHLWIAMTVDENCVEELFDSYRYLVNNEWFTCTVNIAPVDWKIWTKKTQKLWITELVKIHDFILDNIEKWRFLYLNALNKEFRFKMITNKNKWRCLWFYTEAFTNGDVLFNPFVNKEEDYSRYVVWNINDEDFIEKVDKYIGCKFDRESQICKKCIWWYFENQNEHLKNIQMNSMLSKRDRVTEFYAKKIYLHAKKNHNFRKYIDLAKDYMYV